MAGADGELDATARRPGLAHHDAVGDDALDLFGEPLGHAAVQLARQVGVGFGCGRERIVLETSSARSPWR